MLKILFFFNRASLFSFFQEGAPANGQQKHSDGRFLAAPKGRRQQKDRSMLGSSMCFRIKKKNNELRLL